MTIWQKQPEVEALTQHVREVLERRALQISQKPNAAESDEALYWLAEFPLGDEQIGLPLEVMRAALPLKGVTPVPLAPSHVIGILRYQGQVISVLSLASLLGSPGWREDPQTLLVLELGGRRLVAVDCEQIPLPVGLPRRLIEQARSRPGRSGALIELQTADHRQIQLLDVNLLLDRRKQKREEDE